MVARDPSPPPPPRQVGVSSSLPFPVDEADLTVLEAQVKWYHIKDGYHKPGVFPAVEKRWKEVKPKARRKTGKKMVDSDVDMEDDDDGE
jgi:hypothetical protein